MENGVTANKDCCQQRCIPGYRPDPGRVFLRQIGHGLFRLQKARTIRMGGAGNFVRLFGVYINGTAVHLECCRNVMKKQTNT